MIELIPMTESEYKPFMDLSMADHIRGQVKAGNWLAEEAEERMEQMRERFLPEGYHTPDHHFFTIHNPEVDGEVGMLWYFVTEKDGEKLIVVMDIQVYPEHKRQGYASQAFLQMEEQARGIGIGMIALSVFEHNTAARAMYEQLGYLGDGENMVKQLDG